MYLYYRNNIMNKVKKHLECHKEKYMYAGIVTSAFLHATSGMAIKAVLMMVISAMGIFKI